MRDVTFSIVSHGQGALLRALLSDMNDAPTLQGALVIVTLNLRDEAFDVGPFPNLVIKPLKNDQPRGFGANHNQAFAHCRTPWFVILNPDLRFADAEPFTSLVDCGRHDARTGVVAPQVVSSSGELEDSVRTNLSPWSLLQRHLLGDRGPVRATRPARIGQPFYWLAGMCLCVSADAFRTVGGFDERYFLYCEDYDLCARLYNAGYTVVLDASSRIVHDAQRGSHRSSRYLAWHLSSMLRVWRSQPVWRVWLNSRKARYS